MGTTDVTPTTHVQLASVDGIHILILQRPSCVLVTNAISNNVHLEAFGMMHIPHVYSQEVVKPHAYV